jgi:hypothetical protein
LKSRVVVAARKGALAAAAARELETQEKLQRRRRDLGLLASGGGVLRLARRAGAAVWGRRAYSCFRLEAEPRSAVEVAGAVRLQAYEDLLDYDGSAPFASRRELLAHAQEHFSDGDILYSVRVDGRLSLIGWRTGASGGELAEELRRRGVIRAGTSLLHGFQELHGASPPAFEACVRRMLLDCAGESGTVLSLERDDVRKRAVLAALGFRSIGMAVRRRLLGARWSWRLDGLGVAGEHP